MHRFEHRFTGAANRGLRNMIRMAADAAVSDGIDAIERAVLAIEGRVALTAQGVACLRACAADYRAVGAIGAPGADEALAALVEA